MKRVLSLIWTIMILCAVSMAQKADYESNTIIIKLQQNAVNSFFKSEEMSDVRATFGDFDYKLEFPDAVRPEKEFNSYGHRMIDITTIYRLVFRKDIDVMLAVAFLKKFRAIEYAEPLYKVSLLDVPDDPLARPENANADGAYQYWTRNVHSYEAWDICKGDTSIVIGISDTGTGLTHPDLVGNIKVNYDDLPDGIDNDNDGYVDNYKGWNFAYDNNNAQIPHGCNSNEHGAYVSGIAAAVTNNGIGVSGAGYKCKFVPLRIMNDEGSLVNVYQSIVYAANHRFDVVNCSWGSTSYQQMGQDVVNYATINYDVLVVAAAGNEGVEGRFYPASFENVISVAATDRNDKKWNNSSFSTTVDVSAPGTMYVSTSETGYATMWGGTSFASPIVAGSAGILRSYYPSYNAQQIGEIIRVSADNIDTLNYLVPDSIMQVDSTFVEYIDSISIDSTWNEQLYSYDSISIDSTWNEELLAYEYDTVHNEVFVGGYEYDTVHNDLYFGQYVFDTTYIDSSYRVYFNGDYAGMLGNGRLNLYHALTISADSLYSTRFHELVYDRYDDMVDVNGIITNYLNDRSNLRMEISVESPYIQVLTNEIGIGDMFPMQVDSMSVSGEGAIRLLVLPDAPQELTVKMKIRFVSDEFVNEQIVDVPVNGGFVDVNTGSLNLSVAGNGRLGYVGLNTEVGHGFYLDDYYELFYDCGIISGISGSEVYSAVRQISDFAVAEYPHIVDDTLAATHIVAKMLDTLDFNSSNLEIILDVYGDDENYIIAEYSIVNKGFEPVNDYYFGLFADWDLYEPVENRSYFDNGRNFMYCTYEGNDLLYAGMKVLNSRSPINYSLPNKTGGDGVIDISDGFSDLEKYYMISNSSVSGALGDIVQYTGSDAMTIGVGDTVMVSIALFAANSYTAMTDAVDGAVAKYSYLHGVPAPGFVELASQSEPLMLYPNPVSNVLEIRGIEGIFELKVYDSMGRCVFSGENVSRIDVSSYSAGVYTISISDANGTRNAKFVKES
ncbi:MAG: S8 family peptidase [Bacteroidales bacterium]|nr:S8 family peptidase [Bacteroidales bacterium]